MKHLGWVAGLLALGASLPAGAQTSNSGVGIGPSQQLSQPPVPSQPAPLKDVAPSVEHLLGDLGGVRTDLENQGIYLLLDATTEFAGNVSGGVKQGATFANQIGFEADIDWQRLAGIMGLSTHVIIVNRSGNNDSSCSATISCPSRRSTAPGATWSPTWCPPMPRKPCSTVGSTSPWAA